MELSIMPTGFQPGIPKILSAFIEKGGIVMTFEGQIVFLFREMVSRLKNERLFNRIGSTMVDICLFCTLIFPTWVFATEDGNSQSYEWVSMPPLVSEPLKLTSSADTCDGKITHIISVNKSFSAGGRTGFLIEPNKENGSLFSPAINTDIRSSAVLPEAKLTFYHAKTLPKTDCRVMEIVSGSVELVQREGRLVSLQNAPKAMFSPANYKPLVEIPFGTNIVECTFNDKSWQVTFFGDSNIANKELVTEQLTRETVDDFFNSCVPVCGRENRYYLVTGVFGQIGENSQINWYYDGEEGKRKLPLMTSAKPVDIPVDLPDKSYKHKITAYLFNTLEQNKDSNTLGWSKIFPVGLIVRSADCNEANSVDTMYFKLDKNGMVIEAGIVVNNKDGLKLLVPFGLNIYHNFSEDLIVNIDRSSSSEHTVDIGHSVAIQTPNTATGSPGKQLATSGSVTKEKEKMKSPVSTALKGQINQVDLKNSLAAITLGSVDGVKKGTKFHVTRGNYFICDLRIIEVYTDKSVGIMELVQMQPKPGDSVSTDL